MRTGAMKLVHSITTRAWTGGFKAVICSSEGCSQWLSERQIINRRVGVMMGEHWYCSFRCFVSAAEQCMARLISQGTSQPNHISRMPIGLLLLRRGWLREEEFKKATEEQRKTGGEMGELLVSLEFVSEAQVTSVRASQWGCPVFSVSEPTIVAGVYLPPTFVNAYAMTPVHYVSATKSLLVGFVQAVEYGPLYGMEQITGCKAQPCFITASDFRAQLSAQARQTALEELKFDAIQSSAEMARIVCSYGVLVGANSVAMARCKEYLWTRLKSTAKSVDILFRINGPSQTTRFAETWNTPGIPS
jgi:hypothetical protein